MLELTQLRISNGYVGALGLDWHTPSQDELEKAIIGAMQIYNLPRAEIEAAICTIMVKWCESPNFYYDHSYGRIGPVPKPVAVDMVKCDCGHTIPRALRMSASLGSSCPACYDRMSD